MTVEPLWRVEQVAEFLRESVQTVYSLARRGIVPSVRVGRSVRFDPAAITAWAAAGGRREPEPPPTPDPISRSSQERPPGGQSVAGRKANQGPDESPRDR